MKSPLLCTALVLLTSLSPCSAISQSTLSAAERREAAIASRALASADAMAQSRKLIAAGDSGSAVRVLRSAVENDPDNGPLWFEYGSLLSARSRYAWRKAIMPSGAPQMIIAAESSLARASRLSPDSVHYAIAYGKHLWGTNSTSMSKATSIQKAALRNLDDNDTEAAAEAADQVGTMLWRRFEMFIGRGTPLQISSVQFLTRATVMAYIKENYRRPAIMFGLPLFDEALKYFQYAREAAPCEEKYFRHEQMMYAERERWEEMGVIARRRIAERPQQAWPWLTLGLSEHRRGHVALAQAAFDSGFARLPLNDRQRLQSILKVLPPRRENWYDSLASPAKDQLNELFWNTANPSLLLPGNPVLTEFRARVVYAELRFTDDEKPTLGASSHKGEIYIRFGPPDVVMQGAIIGRHEDGFYELHQSWVYYNELMIYTFGQNKLYGTAYQTRGSRTDFDSSASDRPTSWMNVPAMRNRVDSVSVQVARFRATVDSVDVAVFAGIRTGALRRNAPVETSAIRHGLFFVDALGREISRTTGVFESGERDTVTMRAQNYFVRAPSSATAARIEALEPDLMQVARSITDLSGFSTSGFGISDLLISAAVTQPGSNQKRWSDYQLAPLTGSRVPRGSPLALLWESYEAGAVGGKSHLRFTVNVQRESGAGLVAIASRIVGGVRDALTRAGTSSGVAVSYDREFAATPVLVDHLRVELGKLEPGRYRVTLIATDLVKNLSATRFQRFVIVP